ncbi:MAG: heparinase II/III family protein, partial [Phycisphaerae bacterium]
LVHSTLPNLRYLPWGDLQGGPNGGLTHEMACVIDAAAWALHSGEGVWLSHRLAAKRGLRRFYGDTAVFYMLYARRLDAEPAEPARSFFAGAAHGGHFIARSGWGDGDTVVAFTCSDHFGDHHHYDQGSFIVYRHGLLAVDPPVYRKIRGPQQRTENHSTLLIDGKPQRPCRGQWFTTVEAFKQNLEGGRRLECGDILFHRDAGPWAAVAGRFGQAYDAPRLARLVRQFLFVRPGTVVVVDRLRAAEGAAVPPVTWLLQVPAEPETDGLTVTATNGASWIRCRPVHPSAAPPKVEATPVRTHRVAYAYPGGEADGPGEASADRPGDGAGAATRPLVHVVEVGDGDPAASAPAPVSVRKDDGGVVSVTVGGRTFTFAGPPDYAVGP